MYLSHNCEVLEDLYMLNSTQLACNLSSVVPVAFSAKTSALDMMRETAFCLLTVHVTSVPALILLIIIAYGHQGSAVQCAKQNTTPFCVKLMRSQVLYRAAQVVQCISRAHNQLNRSLVDIVKCLSCLQCSLHLTEAFCSVDMTEPLLVINGTDLYWAVPSAPVLRSGDIFSNIFFFGFSWASGSASYLQAGDVTH